MRKKFTTLLFVMSVSLLISLVGCKSKNEGIKEEPLVGKVDGEVEISAGDAGQEIMEGFKNIVEGNNEPFVIVNYIDENIQKVTEEEAVKMIEGLEEVQERYLEDYGEQLFVEDYQGELISLSMDGEFQLFFDKTKIEDIKNANLKELTNKIIEGKYKLITMEGAFYPIIDYEALKTYNEYLSDEMKSYIDIKSIDSNSPTILDAELVSFDELAERLIRTESHLKEYPDGTRYEEILRLFGTYLKFYLEGSDNSPIYEYETRKIRDEVLASYKETASMQDTIISDIVSKYINIIEENESIIDNNVFSRITELYNKAIATLEEYK